jgi:hypothetical protein
MDAHVHYELTRRWAEQAGFSEEEAEAIARSDNGVDDAHSGGLLHPGNWSYHYRLFGADLFARLGLRLAVETGSLRELGTALHRTQDSVAHGWLGLLSHVLDPRVDVWEHRSPRVRDKIEQRSRRMLAAVAGVRGRARVSCGQGFG